MRGGGKGHDLPLCLLRACHLFLSYRSHREQHGPGSMGEVNGDLSQGGAEQEVVWPQLSG